MCRIKYSLDAATESCKVTAPNYRSWHTNNVIGEKEKSKYLKNLRYRRRYMTRIKNRTDDTDSLGKVEMDSIVVEQIS